MSTAQILVLGAIAGSTIFLGLPMARMHSIPIGAKAFMSATATGILIFLLWDVLSAAVEPVEGNLTAGHDGRFLAYSALLGGGFAVGLLSLALYDGWLKRRRDRALLGPGAASVAEFEQERHIVTMSPSHWLSLFIATGIGLHNFAEGLAIGQAAALDELSLALVLIIGFGLHNATEGFGIVAPLAGDKEKPSWGFLAALGTIGGAPTFLGTLLGQAWVSTPLSIAFLALAAGSILFVVIELIPICRRMASKEVVMAGVFVGLVLGFGTDFVLVASGA
jgi:ZIP family zinc transporter